MAELNWSDAQWQKVNDAVTEAFGKASVASAFLPMYGPLSGSVENVRNERLNQGGDPVEVTLDADHDAVNRRLINLTVRVVLSSEQVADETLSNVLLAFRRAANILALEEDRIVFEGFRRGFPADDSPIPVNGVEPQQGLADLVARRRLFTELTLANGNPLDPALDREHVGQAVVSAVVAAIGSLETSFHPAPYACVLGSVLFDRAHEPSQSFVLPADRITPMLKGGPLLRSGMLQGNTGIVVSLAGKAVDVVVGAPPTVQFLQRRTDARFLFRVYERFVLRIRDVARPPVAGFRIPPDANQIVREDTQLRILKL